MSADQNSGDVHRGELTDRAEEPTPALELSSTLRDAIVGHLRATLPNEGVCLIATTRLENDGGDIRRGIRVYPGTNIDASPLRFTMDPREVAGVLRAIAENGWDLGAIAHSHPRGPATLSATDLREVFYPDAYSLIVSFAETQPELKAWSVHGSIGSVRVDHVRVDILDGMEIVTGTSDEGSGDRL
jgi:proteasome lid subunit RPN8/RPN11